MIKLIPKSNKDDRSRIIKLFSSKKRIINMQSFYKPHFIEITIWELGEQDVFKHFIKSIKIPLTFKHFKHIRCSNLPGFLYVRKYGGGKIND